MGSADASIDASAATVDAVAIDAHGSAIDAPVTAIDAPQSQNDASRSQDASDAHPHIDARPQVDAHGTSVDDAAVDDAAIIDATIVAADAQPALTSCTTSVASSLVVNNNIASGEMGLHGAAVTPSGDLSAAMTNGVSVFFAYRTKTETSWTAFDIDDGSTDYGSGGLAGVGFPSIVSDENGGDHLVTTSESSLAMTPRRSDFRIYDSASVTGGFASSDLVPANSYGDTPDVIVAADDTLHIAYADELNGFALMYAHRNAAGVTTTERVGTETGYDTTIALDSIGGVHILYLSSEESSVRYASLGGDGTWTIEQISGGGVAPSMVMDSDDTVHIVTTSGEQSILALAERALGATSFTVNNVATDAGAATIAMDSRGVTYIAYVDNESSSANFLTRASPSSSFVAGSLGNSLEGSIISTDVIVDAFNEVHLFVETTPDFDTYYVQELALTSACH